VAGGRRATGVGLVLAALIAGAGCEKQAAKIELSRIIIDAPPDFDHAQDARAKIRAAIRAQLEADPTVGGFVRRPQASHRLALRVYPLVEEKKRPAFRPVEVTLHSLGEAADYEVIVEAPAVPDLSSSVLQGFLEAWPLLTRLRNLDVQSDERLIVALGDPDTRVRLFAIERLGTRRIQTAVQPLIGLLTADETPEVALRAIGALVAIGDRAAVAPLIDLTYRKDPAFVLRIVFAVSALGGRTAEGFLVTLASGHPHPEIQRGAKDALAEMQKKQGP